MAYLTEAKKTEILNKYKGTMPRISIDLLLDELALMEASIAAGGGIDWGGSAEIAPVDVTADAGELDDFARADHIHVLGEDVVDDTTIELASGVLQVKDAGIGTAKIADGAITGAKLTENAFVQKVFTGLAAPGAVAIPGLKVGDEVLFILNLTDAVDGAGSFEGVISVADQLQQDDVADLSTKTYFVFALVQS